MGGLIGRVLSYTRIAERFGAKVSDVKLDPGGGANETGEHFQAANQDAVPLPGDYLVTVRVQRTGGQVVVGIIDPKQQQTAEPGEHRIYARDADGKQVVQLHMKKDGAARMDNANGFIELQADGTVNINGFTIAPDGSAVSPVSVTAPTINGTTSVQAAGKELVGHDHPAGTPPGNTGPNN